MKAILRFKGYLDVFCEFFMFIFILVIVIAAFMQVFLRYFFNIGMPWTDELCRYMQVGITYIGAAYMMGRKGHIEVDLVKSFMSPFVKKIFEYMGMIFGIILAGVFAYYGYLLAITQMAQISPGTRVPMGIIYMFLPVGGITLILYAIVGMITYNYQSQESGVKDSF